jgi:hypothetical protein
MSRVTSKDGTSIAILEGQAHVADPTALAAMLERFLRE